MISHKRPENSGFFLESRNIFFGGGEKTKIASSEESDTEKDKNKIPDTRKKSNLDIHKNFESLDTNKNGKIDNGEATAERVRKKAVDELTKFFNTTDPDHKISATERANQALNVQGYTVESVEKMHADIIFQDYLKVFENYQDANTETTRRYGVMSGDRIRTLPRSVQHIKGMNIDLEDADYLKEEKLTVSGGLTNTDERFPNLQVLAIKVGDKTITDVFKTGIIKIEAVEQFGVKVGVRVIDGDGDMHLYSTVSGASTVNSEKLALASTNNTPNGAVEQRVLIRKKYEEIKQNEFSDLRIARTKVNNIIQHHIENAGEKVIDWNTNLGDSVFYEKNGEIWIDTKNKGRGDFDFTNEAFLKKSEISGKDIEKYIKLLNTNTELLFGDSIEQIEKNQKFIKTERIKNAKKEQKTADVYYSQNAEKFFTSNLVKKKVA